MNKDTRKPTIPCQQCGKNDADMTGPRGQRWCQDCWFKATMPVMKRFQGVTK